MKMEDESGGETFLAMPVFTEYQIGEG